MKRRRRRKPGRREGGREAEREEGKEAGREKSALARWFPTKQVRLHISPDYKYSVFHFENPEAQMEEVFSQM